MIRARADHLATVLVIAGCFAAVAACGSARQSSGKATGAATPASEHVTRDLAFSECMRGHGVPSFPDPSAGGDLHIPPGVNSGSPGFRDAQRACDGWLPSKGAPPATPAGERSAAVRFARCMRAHGVPQFPDPAFTSPRGAARVLVLHSAVFAISQSVAPDSPAFQQAAGACRLQSL
jgi:hypothetical protein